MERESAWEDQDEHVRNEITQRSVVRDDVDRTLKVT